MAAGGGGAWKVAYADFVTAMMAFFLVMWIVSQDQKLKEAIAHYFVDPMGYFPMGESHSPGKSGGLFESRSNGTVPSSEAIMLGRGRMSHTAGGEAGVATKLASDWLHADEDNYARWRNEAQSIRERTQESPYSKGDEETMQLEAAAKLARSMHDDFYENFPVQEDSIYRDLLMESSLEINWGELAEDLLEE